MKKAIRYSIAALSAAAIISSTTISPCTAVFASANSMVQAQSNALYAMLTSEDMNYDISMYGPSDIGSICAELETMNDVASINFMAADGSSPFSIDDVKAVHQYAPTARLMFNVNLYGKTFSLADQIIEYKNTEIGDGGIAAFEELLPLMAEGTKLILDDCSTSNEAMAQLRESHPDKSIVWRVHFNGYSMLTDCEIIRACGSVTDAGGAENLKYCNEVKYIDFGHNEMLYNIDFMRYMPHLRILILADAPVKTLEPLAACQELMFLEIVNCNNVEDITPLASCTNLRFLNFSNAFSIRDITPLYGLKHLERLYASRYNVPDSQFDEIREIMPDCWVSNGMPEPSNVSYNYSVGWRLDEPYARAAWYDELRLIFGVSEEYYSWHGNRVPVPTPEIVVFNLPEE